MLSIFFKRDSEECKDFNEKEATYPELLNEFLIFSSILIHFITTAKSLIPYLTLSGNIM